MVNVFRTHIVAEHYLRCHAAHLVLHDLPDAHDHSFRANTSFLHAQLWSSRLLNVHALPVSIIKGMLGEAAAKHKAETTKFYFKVKARVNKWATNCFAGS